MPDREDLALIRELICLRPEIVLDDPDVLKCLANHAEGLLGENVIDLRDTALKVLDRRRHKLEQFSLNLTQQSQKNYASVQRIHRAAISIIQAQNVKEFNTAIKGIAKAALQVDKILIIVENAATKLNPNEYFGPIMLFPDGFVHDYFGGIDNFVLGRPRLRTCPAISKKVYKTINGPTIQSEALLPLKLSNPSNTNNGGSDHALLLLGSYDPQTFQLGMGTDLLVFFGQVVNYSLNRWTV